MSQYCITWMCLRSPGPWCLGVNAAPKYCRALHNVRNSFVTAFVISGPLSVRTIDGILLARITHVTRATRNSSSRNRLNGSTLHTPNRVQW